MDKLIEVYEKITNIQRKLEALSKELLEAKNDFSIFYSDSIINKGVVNEKYSRKTK